MKPYLFILIIIILIVSCDYSDSRVQIKNNSNHDISVEILLDTIIYEMVNRPEYYINNKISSGKIRRYNVPGKRGWSFFIEHSVNKKLNVFIFSTDTIKKHVGFESIITNRLYKRYEFEEQKLDNMDWIIEYP